MGLQLTDAVVSESSIFSGIFVNIPSLSLLTSNILRPNKSMSFAASEDTASKSLGTNETSVAGSCQTVVIITISLSKYVIIAILPYLDKETAVEYQLFVTFYKWCRSELESCMSPGRIPLGHKQFIQLDL
jgi:hypothetical protein